MKMPSVFPFYAFLCPLLCTYADMEKRLQILFFILFIASSAFAQNDSTKFLKEVEVRLLLPQKVNNITPVQQISATEFKHLSAYNVADAIRNFSGVNIKDYGGIGGLKTVSVRSLGAHHTGVQFDGVQVTDAQNGQIDLGKIDIENVSSITLYNGHSSDLLKPARSYAYASMLVIKSSEPVFEGEENYRIGVNMKTGSFGLIHPGLFWRQKIGERWAISMNTNWQQLHGKYKYLVDGDGSDTLAIRNNAQVSTYNADLAFYWQGPDSNKFKLRANYQNSSRGLPGAVVFYNPYSNQHLWNKDFLVQSSYQQYYQNQFQLLVNTKFSRNGLRYLDPDYLNLQGELDQRFKQIELYESIAISYPISKQLEMSLSSDVAFNKLNMNLYNYAYPSRFTILTAATAKFELQNLTLQGSLLNTTILERVTAGTASPGKNIWSPAISLAYKPFAAQDVQFRAFYKNIFRIPTFNDLYYTRSGKRDLKPEYAEQYNLGITYNKAFRAAFRFLSLTADAYYNRVKDKIIAIPNKDLFSWTMMNLGLTDIRGLDLGLKTQIAFERHSNFSLSGNYTFQQAIDITDPQSSVYLQQIPYTPKHTIAVNAGISNGKTGVYYNHILSSSRYYLSENLPQYHVPGFSVSDISINQQFQTKCPISLSAEINNLFNTSYAFIRSFPMPGRSFRLSFQITI